MAEKVTYKAKYQVDYRGVVTLGLLLAAGIAALVLKNDTVASLLFAGAVGTLGPSPVRTKPAVIPVTVPPPPAAKTPSAFPPEDESAD